MLVRADRDFPLVRAYFGVLRQHESFNGQFTFEHFDPKTAAFERNRAKPGGGGEESLERADVESRAKPEGSQNGRVPETRECGQQRIACHGARVVVAAFVFVPGIAHATVITTAQRFHDGEPFVNEALTDEV